MNTPENPPTQSQKEWWSRAWVALVEDRREYAELAEEILRERGGLTNTTIHQFTTCEKFINAENFEDFDVCFVDADFGFGQMKGFNAVRYIRAKKPEMIIIGITDHLDYLEAFEETGVNFTLKKEDLIDSLSQILSLAPGTHLPTSSTP